MKKDWERLEEIYKELKGIATHHSADASTLLNELDDFTDIIKSIEDE